MVAVCLENVTPAKAPLGRKWLKVALDEIGTCPILGICLHKPDTNYTQMETHLCDDPKTVLRPEVIFVCVVKVKMSC